MVKKPSEIKRYPLLKNDPLQGWDSADELILQHMSSIDLLGKRILIVNDRFGALSCGLINKNIVSYTDSFVSSKAIEFNSSHQVLPLRELASLDGPYDYVLIQIPKNMSYFEDILCHLTQHLHSGSKIICGSMVKHLAPTSFDLIQKYIGATSTSLAIKKARLIFATFEKIAVVSPYPKLVQIENFTTPFLHHSNIFSREKLDIGTRFFLQHVPIGNFEKILDLGCANGIVGIRARLLNPHAQVIFADESWMAILSAQKNFETHTGATGKFIWTNCYENQESNSIDLVLCNPPFHQQTTIGDFIAQQMFQDSFSTLKKGGRLLVIGNSHLGYQVKMKKMFGNSRILATNEKFVIAEAVK